MLGGRDLLYTALGTSHAPSRLVVGDHERGLTRTAFQTDAQVITSDPAESARKTGAEAPAQRGQRPASPGFGRAQPGQSPALRLRLGRAARRLAASGVSPKLSI